MNSINNSLEYNFRQAYNTGQTYNTGTLVLGAALLLSSVSLAAFVSSRLKGREKVYGSQSEFSKKGQWTIEPQSYLTRRVYRILSAGNQVMGTLETPFFALDSIFRVFNGQKLEAQGIAPFLSVGTLIPSMRTIDVRDPIEALIGRIIGQFWTEAKGKFTFFNAQDKQVATAYIDWSQSRADLMRNEEDRTPFAVFERVTQADQTYKWKVNVLEDSKVDKRMLKVFSAFLAHAYRPIVESAAHNRHWGSKMSIEFGANRK